MQQYILGSGNIVFNATVENKGEDSFDTIFKIMYPSGVHYSKLEASTKSSLVQCSHQNGSLYCPIGNPLPKDKSVSNLVCKIVTFSSAYNNQRLDWVYFFIAD